MQYCAGVIKLTANANIKMAVDLLQQYRAVERNFVHWNSRYLAMSSVPKQCCFMYSVGAFYNGGRGPGDCILFWTTKMHKNVLLAHNKIQKSL